MPARLALVGALAALTALSVIPGLVGGPVYDDRLMVDHPLMDDLGDAAAVFTRTSAAYMEHGDREAQVEGIATWRPLPMLSLILPNALLGVDWPAHHAISLVLHLLCLGLLALRAPPGWGAAVVLVAFALHPVQVEAYVWINGRSDVMAGACLLGLALALRRRSWVGIALMGALGLMCKSVFVIAAVCLVAAEWPVDRGRADGARRALPGAAIALFGGMAGAMLLRAVVSQASSGGLPTPWALLVRLPSVVGAAVEHLALPLPRSMALLQWTLERDGFVLAALAVVPTLAVATLAVRRQLRPAILITGAIATLAPVGVVADHFWLGLDRYLYLPCCLLALAALDVVPAGGRRWQVGAAALAILLVPATWIASSAYASHGEFATRIVEERPEEPTGWLLALAEARRLGVTDTAQLVDSLPTPDDLPPSLAHHVAAELLRGGRTQRAIEVLERAYERHPSHPDLTLDLVSARASQARWAEVVELVGRLNGDDRRIGTARAQLRPWRSTGRVPSPHDAALDGLLGPL